MTSAPPCAAAKSALHCAEAGTAPQIKDSTMQIAHAEDSAQIASIRGKEREFKTLLTGEEGAPDNFRLYFVRQLGAVDIPRHKHNFDQIRVCLEGGPQNFGAGNWIAPGQIAYF